MTNETEEKPKAKTKRKLSPRVDVDVARLAKSKAVAHEVHLEFVIERLLEKWINGEVTIT